MARSLKLLNGRFSPVKYANIRCSCGELGAQRVEQQCVNDQVKAISHFVVPLFFLLKSLFFFVRKVRLRLTKINQRSYREHSSGC